MSAIDMIKQAEADLQEAQAELAVAQELTRAAQERERSAIARAREMHAVLDWLQQHRQMEERAPATSADAVPAAAAITRFGKPVPEVAQTELCLRMLKNLGRTAATKEIRDRLARDGHEFSVDQIRGTLKYLSGKTPPQVVTKPGSGVWRLRTAGAPVLADPAAATDAQAMNGARTGP